MILVGQYDSPFVRRAAVALHHHGLAFERRVLSVFADFDAMIGENPLGKVPVLILDDGDRLWDSRAILEYLDALALPAARLTPEDPATFRRMLRIEAAGIGLAEKVYERGIDLGRKSVSDPGWVARLERQIASAQDWLDGALGDGWAAGPALSRADLAAALAATYLAEKAPALYEPARRPGLEAHRRRAESLPCFAAARYSAAEAAASGWRPDAPG